jgi:aspartate aminotransferase-like enzyme
MLNGDPPLTSSDVLYYALDEGLNMIFEEGLESARRRKEPKAMGLQPLPQTPHAPAPPQLPSRPRQASSPPTPSRPLRRNTASCGGRLEDSVLRLGLMGVQTSYAHLELALSTRGMTLADLSHRIDVGAVQKTCRQIGRAPPTPRGQHARGVSAEGSPWIEPPYRRC